MIYPCCPHCEPPCPPAGHSKPCTICRKGQTTGRFSTEHPPRTQVPRPREVNRPSTERVCQIPDCGCTGEYHP